MPTPLWHNPRKNDRIQTGNDVYVVTGVKRMRDGRMQIVVEGKYNKLKLAATPPIKDMAPWKALVQKARYMRPRR